MLAARLHGFGPAAEVLSLDAIELPPPGPHEVRLDMRAAPINPADLNVIAGTYGQLPELPAIPGNEGAGRVAAVGAAVTTLPVGSLVVPLAPGSWCAARNVAADRVIPLPAGIDPAQAAMLAINPPTAYALLHDFAATERGGALSSLQPGDWVVQNAANSGVGRSVIALARRLGLRTLNVVRRPELAAELLALGADRVVTEATDLRKEGPALMDGARARLALNAVGGASALNLANALAPGSPHVTYGAMARQPLKIPNGLVIFGGLSFRGFWLRRWLQEKPAPEQRRIFALLAEMLRDGSLHAPIHRTYPLREIHAALSEAARERRAGKVLLNLRES